MKKIILQQAFDELNDAIWILAIAHAYRKPEYWIKRKNGLMN